MHVSDIHLSKSIGEFTAHVETVISIDATVEEALDALRKKTISQKIIYFYAVDHGGELRGVVSTRQLLLSDPKSKISEIIQGKLIKLKATQTVKEALEAFDKHSFLALPVVDLEGKLLGALDIQDVTKEHVDLADMNNRAAVFQMIGLTLEDGRKVTLRKSYRLRMPWLLCNVFSGLVCALISRMYEVVLAKMLLLAFFIPLVLTLSESTCMQSMAQSLHFLRRPRFSWKMVWTKGFREWQLTVLLAISSGVLVGALSLLWKEGLWPSITIGLGITCSIIICSVFGILLPIVFHRIKLDPKVASGPVVLMIADMLTTALYLSLATWWLL